MSIYDVHRYLTGPFRSIEGWCIPHLWQSIQPLYEVMANQGVSAPVAEIGVHHGKFFIGLVKMMGASSHNFAIDVFGLQQFNLDGSGKGNLAQFRANLERAQVDVSTVQTWEIDSLTIDENLLDGVKTKIQGFSFFSIDGGHMAEHTVSDLEIAVRLTLPSGIVFVDDYYNANWPGVHEGIAKYYFTSTPRFVPLLFTCNKLFLCHISYHQIYVTLVEEFVRINFPKTRVKRVLRYGYWGLTITPRLDSDEYVKM